MLTAEKALESAKRLVHDYADTRKHYDALWTLQILYDAGRQWATIAEMQSGNLAVQSLPTLVQRATGTRYRVTMDKIHESVVKLKSAISPQHIAAVPRGIHDVSSTYTRTAKRLLDETLYRIEALARIRKVMLPMHVLGSAGVKMVLRQYGGNGPVKQREVCWANIMPWEVIRDPSATTLDPHMDEDRIGHEKPRTLDWMKRSYGWAPDEKDVDSTLGQLLSFHDELAASRGMGTLPGTNLRDSQQKAVMVREFYHRDQDMTNRIYMQQGVRQDWPWMSVCYNDPKKGMDGFAPVPMGKKGEKGLIENPFSDMPMFFFHFDEMIEGMWAAGAPFRLMQGQDILNIAWTWLVQCMQLSAPKWMYQSGTLDKPSVALNNDPWEPIPFKRINPIDTPPQRIQGAQMPSAPEGMVGMIPAWMRESLNMADVQFGKGYKRDGSGKAYEALIRQAESVPEDRITTNELTLARLLRATLVDTIRHSTLGQLRKVLGPEVPDGHVRALKRDDPRLHVHRVSVHPSTLRPKTVGETEEHFASLMERGILQPGQAILETYLQAGTSLDSSLARAMEKQMSEIDRMLAGETGIMPHIGENHEYHIKALQLFLDSPRSEDVPDQIMEEITRHYVLHMTAMEQLSAAPMGGTSAPAPGPSGPANAGTDGFQGTGTAASAGAAVGAA